MKKTAFILLLLLLYSPLVLAFERESSVRPVIELPCISMPCRVGWEERGSDFIRWLSSSVRIGGGSGTMVYYDDTRNEMYVLSCGHLYRMGRGRSGENKKFSTVEVFYQNDKKLPQPKSYKAEYLCHVWDGNYDVSLMKFQPDWKDPWCLPIAPITYKMQVGQWYHNVGCDGMRETAHYLVQFTKERISGVTEIICENNSPRGGRSGGGLISDDGFVVGITSRAGSNMGIWSSVQQIHKFLGEEGFQFILEGTMLARRIPIMDRSIRQGKYAKSYMPMPRLDSNFGIVFR